MKIIAKESFRVPGTETIIEKGQEFEVISEARLQEGTPSFTVFTYGGKENNFSAADVEDFLDGEDGGIDPMYLTADNIPKWLEASIKAVPDNFAMVCDGKPTTLEVLQFISEALDKGRRIFLNLDSQNPVSNGILVV